MIAYGRYLILAMLLAGPPGCEAQDENPAPAGAPSAEIIYTLEQPDGTEFRAVTKGDEWTSREETPDGYTIAKDKSGKWFYVEKYVNKTPVLGNTPAHRPPPANLEKHIRPELNHQP